MAFPLKVGSFSSEEGRAARWDCTQKWLPACQLASTSQWVESYCVQSPLKILAGQAEAAAVLLLQLSRTAGGGQWWHSAWVLQLRIKVARARPGGGGGEGGRSHHSPSVLPHPSRRTVTVPSLGPVASQRSGKTQARQVDTVLPLLQLSQARGEGQWHPAWILWLCS